ncbi:hypothetical protein ACJX0J_000496 [Zea mays]
MDFFLLLIFDPEPEEVVFLCILSMFYIFNKKRIKSIEILLIQKGEIFVIVLSTGATERYILFLYPFLDYMRPKTRNDKKKKITISIKVGKGFSFFFVNQKRNITQSKIQLIPTLRFQIEKLQSFRFVRGDKKRGTIYL